jgi:hypothetical protein
MSNPTHDPIPGDYTPGALADHAAEIIYQVAKVDLGDTDAVTTAVTEIDSLARMLATLREKLTGEQAGPVADDSAQREQLTGQACAATQGRTCLQSLAAGWINPPDLCPLCTRLLMMALEWVTSQREPLTWHQAYQERAETRPAGGAS